MGGKEFAFFESTGRYLILNDPESPGGFFIVFKGSDETYQFIRTAEEDAEPHEMVLSKSLILCYFSLGGADVAFYRGDGNVQLFIYDLLKRRIRQTVNFDRFREGTAFSLSRHRYLLHTTGGTGLLEVEERKGKTKYSPGEESRALYLLPASKRQKDILKCSLIELFGDPEVGTPIPKELVGIVAGFI